MGFYNCFENLPEPSDEEGYFDPEESKNNMYTLYTDPDIKEFKKSLVKPFDKKDMDAAIESTLNEFAVEIAKWKTNHTWYGDPVDIPISIDSNLKPGEFYIGNIVNTPDISGKPKTRFQMIVEKTK